MQRKIIPDVTQKSVVVSLAPNDTATMAAKIMKEKNIAAILVTGKSGKLDGIVTERDLTRRVMAQGLNPDETTLKKIMTKDPDTLAPSDSAGEALELMRTRSFRHLPIVENGLPVAMVSIRDLYSVMKSDLEHEIRETEAFVFGDRYSA